MRIRLTLAYDGTDFAGWQLQPGQRTVQSDLEQALETLYQQPVRVHPSGRTDSGVHALDQVAVYDAPVPREMHSILKALNSLTSADISVTSAMQVDDDFDPRRWAREKHYRYRWQVAPVPDPLRRRQVRWIRGPFDVPAAVRAARIFEGTHDFSSFRAVGCASTHAVRTVLEASISEHGDEVHLDVRGNGFLRHMIRIMAGCVEKVALGRKSVDWVQAALDAQDRSAAGQTLPARGLCLISTRYGDGPPSWAASPDQESVG